MKVIDNTKTYKINYLKVFAIRNQEVKKQIGIFRWVLLSFIEVLFGEELLENLVTTASVKDSSERYKSDDFGKALHLSHHIPDGIFTNLFRTLLIEILYFKYFLQYTLIEPRESPNVLGDGATIDCTHVRFAIFKPKLWQVITFRRVYIVCWVVLNLFIDVLVYCISEDVAFALLSAAIIEGFRRLLKA